MCKPLSHSEQSAPDRFDTTHWTTVLKAGGSQTQISADALDRLCRAYWHPLYAFVRRQGYDPDAAKDLTQGFFTHLLEHNALETVDRAKGKFRTFLLACLKNFIAGEWNRARTIKRGRDVRLFSLDEARVASEEHYWIEPVEKDTPEKLYERRWAQSVVDRVFDAVRKECSEGGKETRFNLLQPFLLEDPAPGAYRGVARKLRLTESAVASAVQRLRLRFGRLFREEISNTVANSEEIDEEIRYLLSRLKG